MVRLTPEVIARAPERTNVLGDRELILRGLGIPVIENTGATNDQYQCIDLSDNEITTLGGFALLKRLRTLILHNNPITSVSVNVARTIPFLNTLIMTDNKLEKFADIDRLAGLKFLDTLVLSGNPITLNRHYRLYTIFKIPSLQVLDFQRIRLSERRKAKQLFESEQGKKFDDSVKEASATLAAKQEGVQAPLPMDEAERKALIRKAIEAAKTPEEIERLEQMLASGIIPNLPGDGASLKRPVDSKADGDSKRAKSN